MLKAGFWRWVAGTVVLVALMGFGVLLIPHYRRNAEFERALEGVVRQQAGQELPADVVRARVLDRAAALGLAVRAGQVRVRRTESGVRIDVRYAVPVDLALYTVDLHFRARAGN